jgi:hypothetical protein
MAALMDHAVLEFGKRAGHLEYELPVVPLMKSVTY